MINVVRLCGTIVLLISTNVFYYLIKLYIYRNREEKRKLVAAKFGASLSTFLIKMGPAFIKFGQLLSTRPDLIGTLISAQLSRLQDKLPQHSFAQLLPEIEKELQSPIDKLFQHIERQAIAAASIAQVHKAISIDGHVVAVKILRPNIEKKFRNNLSLLYFIAKFITKACNSLQRLRLIEIVDTVSKIASVELDLRLEAAAADKLHFNCKDDKEVYIPKIFWQYTSKRILTMEWVDGVPIGDIPKLLALGCDLQHLVSNLAISFFKQAYRDGFFHADLHPGNIFVNKKSQIILLDFGIMGVLDSSNRRFVAEIIWCFIKRDYDRLAQLHFEAGYVPEDQSIELFALACRSIGEPIIGKSMNQISAAKLLRQLFAITEQFQMQTQPQLLLLQKTMVTIEGLGYLLHPEINMWELISPWMKEWTKCNIGSKANVLEVFKGAVNDIKKLSSIVNHAESLLKEVAQQRLNKLVARGNGTIQIVNILIGWALGIATTLVLFSFTMN